jgi:single-stranded DNA-binding protein
MPKLDKNIVFLEGVLGDDFKYGRTKDGKEYATFSLCVNSFIKEISDQTERTHSQNYIRTTVFDKKQVEYLRKVNAHRGQRATIFGRISSFKTEYKGIEYIQLSIIVRDIGIIQTKTVKKKENNGE